MKCSARSCRSKCNFMAKNNELYEKKEKKKRITTMSVYIYNCKRMVLIKCFVFYFYCCNHAKASLSLYLDVTRQTVFTAFFSSPNSRKKKIAIANILFIQHRHLLIRLFPFSLVLSPF